MKRETDLVAISPQHERAIWRAARADRAYWRLLQGVDDNSPLRRALLARRVAVDAELRGHPLDVSGTDDLSKALDVAVEEELGRQRPTIRALVASRRSRRRDAVGCGPAQLRLSRAAAFNRHVRSLLSDSMLNMRQLANAVGVHSATIERAMKRGSARRLAEGRALWFERVKSVTIVDGYYCLVVEREAPRRRPWTQLSPHERDAAYQRAGLLARGETRPASTDSCDRRTAEARAIVNARKPRTRRTLVGRVAVRVKQADQLRGLLYTLLKHGPRRRDDVIAQALAAGYSERQVRRNGQALDLRYLRVGVKGRRGGGAYYLALPAHAP